MSQLDLNIEAPDGKKTIFADIMLPIPIPQLFTYRMPTELEDVVQLGYRVVVQFGKNRILTGIVGKIHHTPPLSYEAKYILEVLDNHPVVKPWQLEFFQWMANYYVCTVGEVLNAALPSGLKLSSQSRVQLRPDFQIDESNYEFSAKELNIITALKNNDSLTYDEVIEVLNQKTIAPLINSLVKKDVAFIFEELKEKYKPRIVKKVRLSEEYCQDKSLLEGLFTQLEKKPKQTDVILKYLQLIPIYHEPQLNEQGLEKSLLVLEGISASSLKTLIKNKIFEEFEEIVSRFDFEQNTDFKGIELSPEQQTAKAKILTHFESKNAVLFHGITGSGKTEIYIDLAHNILENGEQVLYLLPEIALTTQIVQRLQKVFGDKLGIYHSKHSDNERVEVWNGVLSGKFEVVVGVRSAIFLPFDSLGLIIVDEEHEYSYKQYDPAPRYQARDMSHVLGHFHHAKILLGSATPAFETFYQAQQSKYGLVNLDTRYGGAILPEIELVDTRAAKKRKQMHGDFSSELVDAIKESISTKEQVIIFQNRRGYAPYVTCNECAWTPQCNHCSVSLTYHMYVNELRCHYCGYREKVPATCPACGTTKIQPIGFGTEKLEEDLKVLIPEARIQRMDLDTTRKKYSYQTIIHDFERGDIDILIGTQMISKGLDFDRVSLVGVVDADRMLYFPDFRSRERTFQLITQVSGRAGRRKKKGKVIIQTANTEESILKSIVQNDYSSVYENEIQERQQFNYPPFVRIITLTVRNVDKTTVHKAVQALANVLREKLGDHRVFGPEEALISRLRNQYQMQLLVKLERQGINLELVKQTIRKECDNISSNKTYSRTRIVVDVDSY